MADLSGIRVWDELVRLTTEPGDPLGGVPSITHSIPHPAPGNSIGIHKVVCNLSAQQGTTRGWYDIRAEIKRVPDNALIHQSVVSVGESKGLMTPERDSDYRDSFIGLSPTDSLSASLIMGTNPRTDEPPDFTQNSSWVRIIVTIYYSVLGHGH